MYCRLNEGPGTFDYELAVTPVVTGSGNTEALINERASTVTVVPGHGNTDYNICFGLTTIHNEIPAGMHADTWVGISWLC